MFGYIRLLTQTGFYHVESDELRRFSKFQTVFGLKYVREVIFKLVELVEELISEEMSGRKGPSCFTDGRTVICTIWES